MRDMITFSVNPDVYSHMPKVVKLNLKPEKQVEQEWLSEAFLKIVEGKTQDFNLNNYAKVCDKSKLNRVERELPILSVDEQIQGHKGVSELVAEGVEQTIDVILASADIKYIVDSFLDMREYIYLEEGKDLWRLLELSRMEDKKAQRKLRVVMDTYDYLKELIEDVITTPDCFNKLSMILS